MPIIPALSPLTRKYLSAIACFICINFNTDAQQCQGPTSDSTMTSAPKDSASIFLKDSATANARVEILASFPGGVEGWQKFLAQNLRYPVEAMENDIMGETHIRFTVDVDGSVSNIEAVYGHPLLTKESIRIIEASGKWNPATQDGQPVRSYFTQRIGYKLEIDRRGKRRKNR